MLPPVGVSRALNVQLKGAQHADELLWLVAAHVEQFDAINTSTAWNVLGSFLAKAGDGDWRETVGTHAPALHALIARTRALLPRFGAWSLSNSAHGLSRARLAQSAEHRAAALELYAAIGAEAPRALAAPVDLSALADVTVSAAMASASLATAGVGCAFAIGVLSAWSLSGALTAASATHVPPSQLMLVAPAAVSVVCAASAVVVSRALWEGATIGSRLRPPPMRADAFDGGRHRSAAAPDGAAAAELRVSMNASEVPLQLAPSAQADAAARAARAVAGPSEAALPSRALWSGALTAVATSGALGVATARVIADTLPLAPSSALGSEGALALTALPAMLILGASAAGALVSSHLYRSAASGETAQPALLAVLCALGMEGPSASFRPAAVANLAWAFAQADVQMPSLFRALTHTLVGEGSRLCEASVASLATLAGAYARAGVQAPRELLSAISATAAPQLPSSPHHLLTTLAFAFTRAHALDDNLFDALAAELSRRAGALPPHALATSCWAFAQSYGGRAGGDRIDGGLCVDASGGGLGSRERRRTAAAAALVRRLAGVAEPQVVEWSAHEISTLLWALAVARCYSPPGVWAAAWRALREPGIAETIDEIDAAKLYQVEMALSLEAPAELGARLGPLDPALRARGLARLLASPVHVSEHQRRMSSALEALARSVGDGRQLVVRREARVHDGAFSVDALLSCRNDPSAQILVELDGPTHFVGAGPPDVFPNGASALKRRQLALLGLRLVHLPWWEWDALAQQATDVKLAYLRAKLQPAAWPGMLDGTREPAAQLPAAGRRSAGRARARAQPTERGRQRTPPGRVPRDGASSAEQRGAASSAGVPSVARRLV
ncbi:hypothetical protein KFE25_010596 [Diacronema lutheri]|uniref:RAP domain-containing protein n=1 Tax=Diacronema lutheri TaxID=2081491 RepID=A0A8J6C5V4_DIALT|nr:hypothetical protein KFE25_010596 [Diacronema lutheri]